MSQAENLLDSLSAAEIAAYSAGATEEPHVVIGSDRYITVPDSLKRIAVERDKDVETVTFACPRYWDKHDLSEMIIYINCRLPDKTEGGYIATNLVVEDDMIYFDWTIGIEITQSKGNLAFIVCATKTDADGNVDVRWHSELNTDMYVSEGMECISGFVESEYPDIVTQLLERMTVNEGYYAEMQGLISSAQTSATNAAKSETNAAASEANVIEVQTNIYNSAAEIRNSSANAIKGEASGEIVRVDDVSPLEHDVDILVHGKNLFDVSKITNTNMITNNGDGTITIAAGAYYVRLAQKLSDLCPALKVGDVATLSFTSDSTYSKHIYMHGLGTTWNVGMSITMTEEILNSYVCLYGYAESDPLYGQENLISNIQVEKGIVATEYEPYIDPSTVTVTRCGKNLLDVDSMRNARLTKAGDVYTFTKGENAGDRFTNVVPVYIPAETEFCVSAIFDDYTVNDGTLFMIFTYSDGTQAFPGVGFKEKYRYIRTPKDIVSVQFYIQDTQEAGAYIAFRKIQLEIGPTPTDYEPFTANKATADTNGICSVKSASPNMVIYNNVDGAIIEAEYNRDTTKMFESYVLTGKAKNEIAGLVKADISAEIDAIESSLDEIIAIQESLV